MRQTIAGFRASVAGWLREERATKLQTLQLLDALHGGAIEGAFYAGNRQDRTGLAAGVECGTCEVPFELRMEDTPNYTCGCLVDTLEQIRGLRPEGVLVGDTAVTWALAQKIRLGDTPTNNAWARAAADGIVDYLAAKGWR